MSDQEIEKILSDEGNYLEKLRGIVEQSIEQEKLIINNLLNPPEEMLTRGQKISDKMASFGGSWGFIISFCAVLVLWVVLNVFLAEKAFDHYPFILLNLVLSCIAALQAPVIMMSQNRLEEKDRKRAENDYLINLKAEIQIRSLHQKIDLLLEEQIKTLFESQAEQLVLLKEIKRKQGD